MKVLSNTIDTSMTTVRLVKNTLFCWSHYLSKRANSACSPIFFYIKICYFHKQVSTYRLTNAYTH